MVVKEKGKKTNIRKKTGLNPDTFNYISSMDIKANGVSIDKIEDKLYYLVGFFDNYYICFNTIKKILIDGNIIKQSEIASFSNIWADDVEDLENFDLSFEKTLSKDKKYVNYSYDLSKILQKQKITLCGVQLYKEEDIIIFLAWFHKKFYNLLEKLNGHNITINASFDFNNDNSILLLDYIKMLNLVDYGFDKKNIQLKFNEKKAN